MPAGLTEEGSPALTREGTLGLGLLHGEGYSAGGPCGFLDLVSLRRRFPTSAPPLGVTSCLMPPPSGRKRLDLGGG